MNAYDQHNTLAQYNTCAWMIINNYYYLHNTLAWLHGRDELILPAKFLEK